MADGLTAGEQRRDRDTDFVDDIGIDELIEKVRAALAQDPLYAEGVELLYRHADVDGVLARHQEAPARVMRKECVRAALALVTTIGIDVASTNNVGGSCPVRVTTAIGGGASPRSAPRSAS